MLAEAAVAFVENNSVVGVGSGELCAHILQEIGRRVDAGSLHSVKVVAASDAAASEAAFVGIPLTPSADHDVVRPKFLRPA